MSAQPKAPKIRLSCDHCQRAKVRCGQERPSCRRCVNHRTTCQYSPSKRMGRPKDRRQPKQALEKNTHSADEECGANGRVRADEQASQQADQQAAPAEASEDFGPLASILEPIDSALGSSTTTPSFIEDRPNPSVVAPVAAYPLDGPECIDQMLSGDFAFSDLLLSPMLSGTSESDLCQELQQQQCDDPHTSLQRTRPRSPSSVDLLDRFVQSTYSAANQRTDSMDLSTDENASTLLEFSRLWAPSEASEQHQLNGCSKALLQIFIRLIEQKQNNCMASPYLSRALKDSNDALDKISDLLQCHSCAVLPSAILLVCQTINSIASMLSQALLQLRTEQGSDGGGISFETSSRAEIMRGSIHAMAHGCSHPSITPAGGIDDHLSLRVGSYLVPAKDQKLLLYRLFERRLTTAGIVLKKLEQLMLSQPNDSSYWRICRAVIADCRVHTRLKMGDSPFA